ncbi:MAG: hypothetical protein DMF63_08000 [Acidobacteria bacterium]|nr:MAG: hypothetical protein DMF63_08000 [Acidobacteriota bacterium]
MRAKQTKLLIFFPVAIFFLVARSTAQQTIFAIPSSDVLDQGKVSVEFAAAFKVNDEPTLRKFSSFVPRLIVGLGKNVEIGFALTGNIQPGVDAPTLGTGIKWKFYEKRDFAFYVGTNFYIPIKHRAYKAGSTSYVGVSKSIGKARFTGGAYLSTRNVFAQHATRGGGLFGFEYTINKKIGFAADWINGRHAFGFLTSGLVYKPRSKVSTLWAYSIGNNNAKRGNHYFVAQMSYNF